MAAKKISIQQKFAKFCDDCRLAALGIVLTTKSAKFWLIFFPVFLFFGTLLNMLSSGLGPLTLFFNSDLADKLTILGDNFLALFGINKNFGDWIFVFSVAFLQAILISLIIIIWRKRSHIRSSSAQNAGIAAGLALLGSGCPTCGTTLITPIISVFFSSGSYAIAGTISQIMTIVAIIILLFSLKKIGLEVYVIIKDEKWRKKHQKEENGGKKIEHS